MSHEDIQNERIDNLETQLELTTHILYLMSVGHKEEDRLVKAINLIEDNLCTRGKIREEQLKEQYSFKERVVTYTVEDDTLGTLYSDTSRAQAERAMQEFIDLDVSKNPYLMRVEKVVHDGVVLNEEVFVE